METETTQGNPTMNAQPLYMALELSQARVAIEPGNSYPP